MTGPDDKLANLIQGAAPAERDPMFRVRIMQRREAERFRSYSRVVVLAAGGVVLLALVGVVLRPIDLLPLAVVIAGIVAAVIVLFYGRLLARFVPQIIDRVPFLRS